MEGQTGETNTWQAFSGYLIHRHSNPGGQLYYPILERSKRSFGMIV